MVAFHEIYFLLARANVLTCISQYIAYQSVYGTAKLENGSSSASLASVSTKVFQYDYISTENNLFANSSYNFGNFYRFSSDRKLENK